MGYKTIIKDDKPVVIKASNPGFYQLIDNNIKSAEQQKAAVESEMAEIVARYKAKVREMNDLAEEHRIKKRRMTALDVASFLEQTQGWQVGGGVEYCGKVYRFLAEGMSVNAQWDYCDDVDAYGARRNSWCVYVSLGKQGRGPQVAQLYFWQDSGGCYYSDIDSKALPTTYPIGSQYPTREQILNTLRGAGAKLEERGFSLQWQYKYRAEAKRGTIGKTSRVSSLIYKCHDLTSLRNMAFHQNRYNHLVKRFTSRDFLESHEYQEHRDPDGNLTHLCAVLNFKMIAAPEGETEDES